MSTQNNSVKKIASQERHSRRHHLALSQYPSWDICDSYLRNGKCKCKKTDEAVEAGNLILRSLIAELALEEQMRLRPLRVEVPKSSINFSTDFKG
jgi:hypothetical protein